MNSLITLSEGEEVPLFTLVLLCFLHTITIRSIREKGIVFKKVGVWLVLTREKDQYHKSCSRPLGVALPISLTDLTVWCD